MHQALDRILYGLCFGIGFWIGDAFAQYQGPIAIAAGVTLGVVAWLLWVAVLLVHLGAIVAALSERRLQLPGISRLATRLAR